jgi:hypothetical protein
LRNLRSFGQASGARPPCGRVSSLRISLDGRTCLFESFTDADVYYCARAKTLMVPRWVSENEGMDLAFVDARTCRVKKSVLTPYNLENRTFGTCQMPMEVRPEAVIFRGRWESAGQPDNPEDVASEAKMKRSCEADAWILEYDSACVGRWRKSAAPPARSE